MEIAAEIRAELAKQQTNYTQLAEKIGTSRQRVWKLVADNKRPIRSDDLKVIADALRVPAWELMRRAEEGTQQ